jgi:hypothetical protein
MLCGIFMDATVWLIKNEKPMHLLVAIQFLWMYHEEYEIARIFSFRSGRFV